ncbi:MAG: hypothetical protein IPL78_18385 [Chloroflexi bacterium]|nr:hypothetical protein [Chloroflexota bacterium]
MNENHDPSLLSQAELQMRQFRERVSSLLAGLIVVVAVIVLLVAVATGLRAEEPGQAFTNVKDVLGFLNPLLGVILGYYFNKVSSENRAENAEKTARIAAANAQQADDERQAMWQQAQQIEQQMKQMRVFMAELTQAAQAMLDHPQSEEAVSFALGDETGQPQADDKRVLELWRAVENARQWGLGVPADNRG